MKSFEWLSISSEDDIKNEESLNQIRGRLLIDTNLDGLLEINNKKNLLRVIIAFQKARKAQLTENEFFISEKHRLAFLLLKHEGNIFDEELGISKKHYIDNEVAKEWRNGLAKIFHPDKDLDSDFKENESVMNKITVIYNRMVGKA